MIPYFNMEKRKFKRVTKRIKVTIPACNRRYTTYAGDISETGIFLRTSRVFPPGTILTLELQLPLGEILVLRGKVKWEFMIPHLGFKRNGMGIEFIDRSTKYVEFVKNFYSSIGRKKTAELVYV